MKKILLLATLSLGFTLQAGPILPNGVEIKQDKAQLDPALSSPELHVAIYALSNFFGHINHLDFSGCLNFNSDHLKKLSEHPNLNTINLSGCSQIKNLNAFTYFKNTVSFIVTNTQIRN